MRTIIESGMKFGEFPDEALFVIENSELHASIGKGTKTVEFILLRDENKLVFVEAKTTCPNAANRNENEDKQTKFEEYYKDISDKFIDSFHMFLLSVLHRNDRRKGIGEKLAAKKDYSKTDFCFILVIKEALDETWLAGPKAELEERLKYLRKMWKVKVIVLNDKLAKEYGLIMPT